MQARRLSVHELKARLDRREPVCLVDVRTPGEIEIASLPGAVTLNGPADLNRLAALNPNTPIVVFCHHGHRSDLVAMHLERLGHGNVSSLEGGIEAWSLDIDPNVPRY